ncbi:MAG: HAD family hydrolase [Caulobacterales bacterium 68-7]|nr:HAD hydrolase-like protein [Caulobacterales bacterium]OJU12307.1 MAG: HAD family hydrolase [Caulobacterales bacterium 68-7]
MIARPYDLAIFDFDGVLADSEPWVISVFNSVADKFHFKRVDHAEIEMLRSKSSREIMAYLGVPLWRLPAIGAHMRSLSSQAAGQIPMFDGVDILFERLSAAGIPLAIVSSNGEDTVRKVLGPANAARVWRFDCGAAVFGKAAKFKAAAKAAGVPLKRVACIGDETRDVEAARKAGSNAIAVTWGYATRDALNEAGADLVVDSFDDLAARLASA